MGHFQRALQRRLMQQQEAYLWRIPKSGSGFLNFASNDYLGLSHSPAIKASIQSYLEEGAAGAGASHLVSGHTTVHDILEKQLAEFLQTEAALVFSTGYMANLAVFSVLPEKEDKIFADKFIHASMVDGAQLSSAEMRRYPHLRFDILKDWLNAEKHARFCFIATEGTFSMEGDENDIEALKTVLREYQNAVLLLDDAHSIGVKGAKGEGFCPLFQEFSERVVTIATFSKAFGLQGGFVAGSFEVIEALTQFARTYIYTTAMPPAYAAGIITALQCIEQGDALRETLHRNIVLFQRLLKETQIPFHPNTGPIQIIPVGDEKKVIHIAERLERKGILVGAIRTPTVAKSAARLRITISAQHNEAELHQLVTELRLIGI